MMYVYFPKNKTVWHRRPQENTFYIWDYGWDIDEDIKKDEPYTIKPYQKPHKQVKSDILESLSYTINNDTTNATSIVEDNNGFHITIEAPNIDVDTLDITVIDRELKVKYKKHEAAVGGDGAKTILSEIKYGDFERTIKLPSEVLVPDGASYENGVLTLFLQRVYPSKVKVNVK